MGASGGTLTLASPDWLAPALLLFAAGAALVLWGHRRASAGAPAAALRIVGFALLALCLVEPSWTTRHAKPGANLFVVLADDSRSLALADGATGRPRGEILRETVVGDPPWLTRLAEVFQIRRYAFDVRLRRSQDFRDLGFAGEATNTASALRTLADRYRGGPLAGILVLSDGNATDLDAPLDVAGLPPVYPVIIGSRDRPSDISVAAVSVSQTAFEDAPVTIAAQIEATAQKGRTIAAELYDADGNVVQTQRLAVSRDDETLTARFRLRPAKAGIGFYRVRLGAPGAREATLANNDRLVLVDRPRGPYRILYVGGRPNWDYKFLRRAVDEDAGVELVAILRIAHREPKFAFRSRAGETTNPLFRGFGRPDDEAERYDQPVLVRLGTRDAAELAGGFPKTAEELFAYHALVLDDLEAGFFTADQLALIERFVSERGGGLLMLGGQGSFGQGRYDRTPIAQLLPVYLDRLPETRPSAPVRLTLSREGWLEAWARLRDNEAAERDRLSAMPPFHVVSRVRGVKPGATVLATVSSGTGASHPALVVQRFGNGRAGALTLGDLWRWALGRAEVQPDLAKLWRQTMRWLVTDVPERVAVRVERRPGEGGQRLALRVRVRDRAFRPADDAAVALEVTGPDGEKTVLPATPAAGEPGLYEATHLPRKSGPYRVRARVSDAGGGVAGEAESGLALDLAAEEHRSARVDGAALDAVARRTGGRSVARSDLVAFARALPAQGAPVSEPRTRALWHGWATFLGALLCFAAEWTLRRRRGLA